MRSSRDVVDTPGRPNQPDHDPPDERGTSCLMVQLGSFAAADCERWLGELPPHSCVAWVRPRDVAEAKRLVEEAVETVSLRRLLLSGPLPAVLDIRNWALALGFADGDITIASDGSGLNVVRCAHCGADSHSDAPWGGITTCDRCGSQLVQQVRVSRRPDCFLGDVTAALGS